MDYKKIYWVANKLTKPEHRRYTKIHAYKDNGGAGQTLCGKHFTFYDWDEMNLVEQCGEVECKTCLKRINESKQAAVILTGGGNGYSSKTNTLFINKKQAAPIIRDMVDKILADHEANGFDCWKCGKNRPYNPKLTIECPHCLEWDYVPF